MPECPSCGSSEFSPDGSGSLICAICGEQLTTYHQEETDAFISGTAIYNRSSQSQIASQTRERVAAPPRPAPTTPAKKTSWVRNKNYGPFSIRRTVTLVREIVRLLQTNGYQLHNLRQVLVFLVSFWAEHVTNTETRLMPSESTMTHAFALVSLACLHISLPILPRDIRALITVMSPAARAHAETFAKLDGGNWITPSVREMTTVALWHVSSGEAWPRLYQWFPFHNRYGNPATTRLEFPIAQVSFTVLRLCRLIGASDAFGQRVCRYLDLEQVALTYAQDKTHSDEPTGLTQREKRKDDNKKWVTTDESLQIAVINTMRLCYYQGQLHSLACENEKKMLVDEWDGIKEKLFEWLQQGHYEDAASVTWACMSPLSLSTACGSEIELLSTLADATEKVPPKWRPGLNAHILDAFSWISEGAKKRHVPARSKSCPRRLWQEIPSLSSLDGMLTSTSPNRMRTSNVKSHGSLEIPHTKSCCTDSKTSIADGSRESNDPRSLYESQNDMRLASCGTQKISAACPEDISDSVVIAMAWVVIRAFFTGCHQFSSGDQTIRHGRSQFELAQGSNVSLRAVLSYLRDMEG